MNQFDGCVHFNPNPPTPDQSTLHIGAPNGGDGDYGLVETVGLGCFIVGALIGFAFAAVLATAAATAWGALS